MTQSNLAVLACLILCGSSARAEQPYPAGAATPEIANFLGGDGFGSRHDAAPPEAEGFGRLVGLWDAKPEMKAQDGSWVEQAPALWAWQYALDGFATQDLWFHSADNLPSYMASLGRPYLLTGLRIFEASSSKWRVAWAANGAGAAAGMDFGVLEGTAEDGNIVLRDESQWGHQRITFSKVTDNSFLWTSEMSRDGKEWATAMRVKATRRE